MHKYKWCLYTKTERQNLYMHIHTYIIYIHTLVRGGDITDMTQDEASARLVCMCVFMYVCVYVWGIYT